MSMILQGRQIYEDDIDLIRRLMADNPDWGRSRLSMELCRLWDWRTDTGVLKDMACRSMLRKLEQRRLIVLPAMRSAGPPARRIRDVEHCRDRIQADLQSLRPMQIELVSGSGHRDHLFHCLMNRYHYLGCRGHVGEHLKYLVHDCQGRPLAALLFGSAAWRTVARDRFIGWDTLTRPINLKLLTNNTRFLILPWVKVVNLASFVLGAVVKRLSKDWQYRYGHDLCLVETFVDRSRFAGTCYQAANWIRIGETKGRSRQDRHNRLRVPVKDLYIYPLAADFRQRLCIAP